MHVHAEIGEELDRLIRQVRRQRRQNAVAGFDQVEPDVLLGGERPASDRFR